MQYISVHDKYRYDDVLTILDRARETIQTIMPEGFQPKAAGQAFAEAYDQKIAQAIWSLADIITSAAYCYPDKKDSWTNAAGRYVAFNAALVNNLTNLQEAISAMHGDPDFRKGLPVPSKIDSDTCFKLGVAYLGALSAFDVSKCEGAAGFLPLLETAGWKDRFLQAPLVLTDRLVEYFQGLPSEQKNALIEFVPDNLKDFKDELRECAEIETKRQVLETGIREVQEKLNEQRVNLAPNLSLRTLAVAKIAAKRMRANVLKVEEKKRDEILSFLNDHANKKAEFERAINELTGKIESIEKEQNKHEQHAEGKAQDENKTTPVGFVMSYLRRDSDQNKSSDSQPSLALELNNNLKNKQTELKTYLEIAKKKESEKAQWERLTSLEQQHEQFENEIEKVISLFNKFSTHMDKRLELLKRATTGAVDRNDALSLLAEYNHLMQSAEEINNEKCTLIAAFQEKKTALLEAKNQYVNEYDRGLFSVKLGRVKVDIESTVNKCEQIFTAINDLECHRIKFLEQERDNIAQMKDLSANNGIINGLANGYLSLVHSFNQRRNARRAKLNALSAEMQLVPGLSSWHLSSLPVYAGAMLLLAGAAASVVAFGVLAANPAFAIFAIPSLAYPISFGLCVAGAVLGPIAVLTATNLLVRRFFSSAKPSTPPADNAVAQVLASEEHKEADVDDNGSGWSLGTYGDGL